MPDLLITITVLLLSFVAALGIQFGALKLLLRSMCAKSPAGR